ncbi:Ankyrin repeat-containing protein family [Melia azedarach]|uniref:Ankyrin repeat-containing protein family n=1 Tax=Melia azedarach TaxID=155640 RepID=A0ACC1WXM4_MELAZ|nr:Ankyrin repeat-containing protein family [Melia azedarach]
MREAYRLAMLRDWQGFEKYYHGDPNALFNPLTVDGDTAFHFAAGSENPKLSEKFVALTTSDDLGNTPLHEVAVTDCVEAAQHMVAILLDPRSWPDNEDEKKKLILTAKELLEEKKLPDEPKKILMRNKLGETPLEYNEEMNYLLPSQGQDLEIGNSKNDNIMTNIDQAKYLTTFGLRVKETYEQKQKDESALRLVELLVEQDSSWKESYKTDEGFTVSLGLGKGASESEDKPKTPTENSISSSSTTITQNDIKNKKKRSSAEAPLLMAASNGIIEIWDAVLLRYPQAVDYVNHNGHNVFHTAVIYRQKKIFSPILELEERIMEDLAARVDKNGNSSFHHVGNTKYYEGGTRFGPALEFQEELQWFEKVREKVPDFLLLHRNDNRITAGDLFKEQHKNQYESGQQWMKNTAESCSTVSILVATVVFAAAYTMPGGNDENGVPVFIHSPLFAVFTIMDVVSLITSLCSVVMFLSILTSPFDQFSFFKSLPNKLRIDFILLFFSVLSSMITFTAALLLLIRLKGRWRTNLVYAAAFIPVVLFGVQFHIYSQIVADIFKKVKPVLVKKKKHRYLNHPKK